MDERIYEHDWLRGDKWTQEEIERIRSNPVSAVVHYHKVVGAETTLCFRTTLQNFQEAALTREVAFMKDVRAMAEWHMEDGDECGVIARRVLAALPKQSDSE